MCETTNCGIPATFFLFVLGMLGDARARAAIFGSSARLVWDVGDWDNSTMLVNLGQSGDPLSKHYLDQLRVWLDGETQRLPFSKASVGRDCTRRLRLAPAGGNGRERPA